MEPSTGENSDRPHQGGLRLESFLPYRLNRLAEAVSSDFARIYREREGMTRPEWRLLATLGQYGTMTATEVGAHSAMHKTKVSRAVAALERRRWLHRRPHEGDRRVEHLELSAAGRRAYDDLVPEAVAYENSIYARMSDADRKAVARALATLERLAVEERGAG